MNMTMKRFAKFLTASLMMVMFAMPFVGGANVTSAISVTPVYEVHAVGDVDVSISNGKLDITGGGFEYEDSDSAWNGFISKYRGFIVGVSGLGAVSMIAFFIMNFLKLGAVSTNPSERAKVLQGLIWSGLAAAGLGAVSIIVGFFYGALM